MYYYHYRISIILNILLIEYFIIRIIYYLICIYIRNNSIKILLNSIKIVVKFNLKFTRLHYI